MAYWAIITKVIVFLWCCHGNYLVLFLISLYDCLIPNRHQSLIFFQFMIILAFMKLYDQSHFLVTWFCSSVLICTCKQHSERYKELTNFLSEDPGKGSFEFITLDSEVIMFSAWVFVCLFVCVCVSVCLCLSRCLSGRFNYERLDAPQTIFCRYIVGDT